MVKHPDNPQKVLQHVFMRPQGILRARRAAELRDLYDLMIFVDVADDTRLARRVRRDIVERGRDVLHVLDHYERTVKPAFTQFIEPTKQYSHIILPRGLDNTVAIDLIQQHIAWRLSERMQPAPAVPAGAGAGKT